TRDFLNKLEDRSPGIKYSIINSGEKIAKILRKNIKVGNIGTCENCGEPSSEKICKACKIIEEFL
ncbi:MAG: TIGR00269 family protein, partial [Candidatus Aenigmatarchaeota archaeon]